MSPKIDFISDISSNKMMWTLKVRVVRFWKVTNIENADNVLSLEMLLQDERGGRIQASLGKSVMNRFQIEIKELGLYYMKNFVVCPNKLKYKTNDHQFKLIFTHRTSVEETIDAHFGMEVFNFRPFEHLINQVNVEVTKLFDVIGEIVSYGPIQEHKQGDKSSAFMNVELQDHENNNISTTFWGEFVEQIMPHLDTSIENLVIVVMQLIRSYKFQGKYSVRNSWHASKLWINPNLPQVAKFSSRLENVRGEKSERISQISSQRNYSAAEELASGTAQVKTIRNLVECLQKGSFWIVTTIVYIELKNGWSYLSCIKCARKVYKVGSKFNCPKCKSNENSALTRYRLQVRVMDNNGSVSLLIWDRDAIKLIGKTANELRAGLLEKSGAADAFSYPSEMDNILDRRVIFKVAVKSDNIENHDEVYGVIKFSEDEDLIKQYGSSPSEDAFYVCCFTSISHNI
ncbi:replication factor A protein 1-like [Lycium barbarum]|uniref:replication factor A protein 1-like n=1 Tax=Lycium barbarum TaxID=112863 RepID=UPI00293F4AC0|nr:replication factor A protein 1-like [Lycium barbarum]